MAGIEELLAQTHRPVLTVPVCLRGDLLAERNRVATQSAAHKPTSLADTEGVELKARLAMLDAAVAKATVEFTFKAMQRNEYRQLRDSFTQDGDKLDQGFLDALVAASLSNPDLTGDEVRRFLDALSEGQAAILEDAAWAVNQDTDAVPLSLSG